VPASVVLESVVATFRSTKALADRALEQLGDDDLHRAPTPESNSVAVIVQHVVGNLRSRFTDFLATDGEKPWRDRDSEFVERGLSRADLLARWEEGWAVLFATLASLSDADLPRTVTVRGEPHTVARALDRQLAHYGYHVGQIVYVARWLRGSAWKTLSVPRGGSDAFNREMLRRHGTSPAADASPPPARA
jgi:hypothetical protein